MNYLAAFSLVLINLGLLSGLMMGVLVLLRPVLVRVCTPGQRVFLWWVVMLASYFPGLLDLMSLVSLPFPTLLSLVTPRNEGGLCTSFVLPYIRGEGTYNLALPGGNALPVYFSRELITLLGVGSALFYGLLLVFSTILERKSRQAARQGRELWEEDYRRLGVERQDKVTIRLCPHLPTSFVVQTSRGYEIALQQELSPEQLRLVLLHEAEHARRRDPGLLGTFHGWRCLFFWNPLIWAACHFVRRDVELACDQRVLKRLEAGERRAYARTLVDLACDRPLPGSVTTFGECDASLRVKEAARWHPDDGTPAPLLREVLGWGAAGLLAVFLVMGAPQEKILLQDVALDVERIGLEQAMAPELERQGISVSSELWVRDSGSRYGELYFQDQDGDWWLVFFRRRLREGQVDFSLRSQEGPPDLERCLRLA